MKTHDVEHARMQAMSRIDDRIDWSDLPAGAKTMFDAGHDRGWWDALRWVLEQGGLPVLKQEDGCEEAFR